MRFLDAGRAAADAGMHLIAVGRFDDFYKSTSESFKSRYSPEQFDLLAKLLKESVGAIVSYEYRNQAIEYPAGSPLSSDLSKATSNTFFNLKLSKGGGGGIFMDIETTVEDGKHVISFITTNNYGSNVPPWLSRR